jgi:hypothetical protein
MSNRVRKDEIIKLMLEFIQGHKNCNTPIIEIERIQAILNDFYNTKIKYYKENQL